MKKIILYAAALGSLSSAVLHLSFWKFLSWPGTLQCLDSTNRALIQMLNIDVLYVFLYITVITVIIARSSRVSKLSRSILLFACGIPLLRVIFGIVLFEISRTELIVQIRGAVLVILFALSYYISGMSDQKKSEGIEI